MTPVIEDFNVSRLEVAQRSEASEDALERSDSPRHRYLPRAWKEILDPSLTGEDPVGRFRLVTQLGFDGRVQVPALHGHRTAGQARKLLDPFIESLPAFELALVAR
ncbi:MAG TPA: hypothetical protein VE990_12340 [Acidimicrobiales bacterium]|nr:hypothetical protein [Acidimicrobiales bacterium]